MSRDRHLLQQVEFVKEQVLNNVFVCPPEIKLLDIKVHVMLRVFTGCQDSTDRQPVNKLNMTGTFRLKNLISGRQAKT